LAGAKPLNGFAGAKPATGVERCGDGVVVAVFCVVVTGVLRLASAKPAREAIAALPVVGQLRRSRLLQALAESN